MSKIGVFVVIAACASTPKAVHFELSSQQAPLIVVPVWIDGQGPFHFVLDTGASSTVVSRAVAEKLGLSAASAGTARGLGAGGEVGFALAKLDSLAVGDASLKGVDVAVGDIAAIGKADGILGYNFLARFRVSIDYGAATIAFTPAP